MLRALPSANFSIGADYPNISLGLAPKPQGLVWSKTNSWNHPEAQYPNDVQLKVPLGLDIDYESVLAFLTQIDSTEMDFERLPWGMSTFNMWLHWNCSGERLDRDIVRNSGRYTQIDQHLHPCKLAAARNLVQLHHFP